MEFHIFLKKSLSRTQGLDMIQPPNQIQKSCLFATRAYTHGSAKLDGRMGWIISSALVDEALFWLSLLAEAGECVRNVPTCLMFPLKKKLSHVSLASMELTAALLVSLI
jgi:hypothetical protein